MKHVKLFEEFLLEQELSLYEIGEGSRPFPYALKGGTKVGSWMNEIQKNGGKVVRGKWETLTPIMYSFKSDKATYYARISGGYEKHMYIPAFQNKDAEKPQDYNMMIIVGFDIEGATEEAPLTNFGEQFRVVTTVTDIVVEVVKEISSYKWVKLQEIRLVPKMEDVEEGKPIAQTKRGRLYLEYIKKQGNRLPGDWTVNTKGEYFEIRRGKWSGGNDPSRFIQL